MTFISVGKEGNSLTILWKKGTNLIKLISLVLIKFCQQALGVIAYIHILLRPSLPFADYLGALICVKMRNIFLLAARQVDKCP